MYHLQVEMSCWTCIRVGSSIWAVNLIFAKRHILTYCIHCSRPSVRANDFRACACTSRMIHALLSTLESAIDGAKGNPNMSIRSLNGMSSGVVGSAHPAIVNAFEFRGLSPAPLACSYMLMACRIVVKVVGSVIKTVTLSAYARTVVFRCRRPIFMLGSDSSRDRTRGCTHSAYRHILSGHPCLFPLWMAVGPRRVPFICTDA